MIKLGEATQTDVHQESTDSQMKVNLQQNGVETDGLHFKLCSFDKSGPI